jgi:hypothetical protein
MEKMMQQAIQKLSKQMTPQDISKAQDLARECVERNYKDC